tara:strand:- start:86 stop:607 length:522 start_codon:yes stop_codon:yes gene_type:complete
MIQAEVKKDFDAYINTKANQIMLNAGSISVPMVVNPNGYIFYLAKFTNDYSGEILYCYADPQDLNPRYSKFDFTYNAAPDMFKGEINLSLAGYYHYEFYEVWWEERPPVPLTSTFAPACELPSCILDATETHGIVKGLVAIGKMYVAEEKGKEEVQYTEYVAPIKNNYIYQGT